MRFGRLLGTALRSSFLIPPNFLSFVAKKALAETDSYFVVLVAFFSVKDHPHVSHGYKTRFFCAQDAAHHKYHKKSSASTNTPNPNGPPSSSSTPSLATR